MGAQSSIYRRRFTRKGGNEIKGIDIDLHDVGELTPSIAAVAARLLPHPRLGILDTSAFMKQID
jgi:hypothetical protein